MRLTQIRVCGRVQTESRVEQTLLPGSAWHVCGCCGVWPSTQSSHGKLSFVMQAAAERSDRGSDQHRCPSFQAARVRTLPCVTLCRYIDKASQKAAWAAGHREECKAMRRVAPRLPPTMVRLASRVLWRKARCVLTSSELST